MSGNVGSCKREQKRSQHKVSPFSPQLVLFVSAVRLFTHSLAHLCSSQLIICSSDQSLIIFYYPLPWGTSSFKKLVLSNQQSKNHRDSAYRMSNKGSVNISLNLDLMPDCVDGFIEVYGRWPKPCDCWWSNTSRQHTSQTNLTTDYCFCYQHSCYLYNCCLISRNQLNLPPFDHNIMSPVSHLWRKRKSHFCYKLIKKVVNYGVLVIHLHQLINTFVQHFSVHFPECVNSKCLPFHKRQIFNMLYWHKG